MALTREEKREYDKKYYRKNKKKIQKRTAAHYWKNRELRLEQAYNAGVKRKYGITIEEVNRRKKEQGNRCAICRIKFSSDRRPDVDHNHKTGKARGILCHKCNYLIGYAKDSLRVLKNAVKYMEKWNGKRKRKTKLHR